MGCCCDHCNNTPCQKYHRLPREKVKEVNETAYIQRLDQKYPRLRCQNQDSACSAFNSSFAFLKLSKYGYAFDQDGVLNDAKVATYGLFLRGHGPPTICSCDHSSNCIPFLWRCLIDDGLSICAIAEFVRKSRKYAVREGIVITSREQERTR